MTTSNTRKLIVGNSIIMLAATAFWLVTDYFFIKSGQEHNHIAYKLSYLLMLVPLAFFISTFSSMSGRKLVEKAILSTIIAFGLTIIGFILLMYLGISFHLSMGGTL